MELWNKGVVPNFVSSNAYIAHSYAQLIIAFLQDGMKEDSTMPLDMHDPLYIVELGAGKGKFSHLRTDSLRAAFCMETGQC